jgi:hypothetical protein
MAISELASSPAPIPGRAAAQARATDRAWSGLPLAIAVLLLATIVYSAFAHGAATRATTTRVELVIVGLAATAALGWIWMGVIQVRAPRATLVGVGLLVAFAGWSGLTVLWSISPDQTWIEVNRVATYALVVALGVAVAASHARALELIAKGFVLAALAVTVYALGQKVVPGLYSPGVFNASQGWPRLQDPLGYWNALAMFIVMGTPAALALTVDRARSAGARLSTACGLAVMLMTIPLTYSRGGLIGLVVALAVGIGLSRERLRAVIWLIASALAALPAVLAGLLLHELSSANVPLGTREWAGGVLAAAALGGVGVLVLAGRRLMVAEPHMYLSARQSRTLRNVVLGGVAALLLAGLLALALSSRGFTGTISHAWHGFTTTHNTTGNNPERLLSAASENRWVWWKEAAAAFSARPLQGWGAGSFPVLHLLYRKDTIPVQQPHSVPLQFLAETGVVGALLGIGAFLLLAAGAIKAVRSRPEDPERLLAAALLGAALAYGVHCLYDWDWNIPALSLPAFLFLGVVAGRHALPRTKARRGSGIRALALAAATLWLCIFALSIALPQLAADKASAALVAASSSSPATVRAAQAEASLASQLDPLSDAGLYAEATVALHDSRPKLARMDLLQAVGRNPSDPLAWQLLFDADGSLGYWTAGFAAAQQAVNLDPMGSYAQTFVAHGLHKALPSSSATRFPTPPG